MGNESTEQKNPYQELMDMPDDELLDFDVAMDMALNFMKLA